MAAIEVHELTKRYGTLLAVDGISFAVNDGEIFGLLGPNGAGKSTLIRMLTTLIEPTSGSATVGGFDIHTQADAARCAMGVLPQAMTSDLQLTAMENLMVFAGLYGVPRGKRVDYALELLDAVEMRQWQDKPLKFLSGGMRRRVEIARGLIHQPSILVLDEPTTGLDPVSRAAVWTMLSRLREQKGLSVLITTHYMDEADRLCDRIAIVDGGKVVALDSPVKLKASISDRNMVEATFAGAPDAWPSILRALPAVTTVTGQDEAFRMGSDNMARTLVGLGGAAEAHGVTIASIAAHGATLDDVFVRYTGRRLRDGLQQASPADRLIRR